jgi:glycosyltransferase involved in cell wall biosynthesis
LQLRASFVVRPVILASADQRPSILGVARSLEQGGLLHRFVTTFALPPMEEMSWLERLVVGAGKRLGGSSGSRNLPAWLARRTRTYPSRELIRVAAQRLGAGAQTCERIWEWAETAFDRYVARTWSGLTPCLYGCEHASVESFEAHKQAGGFNFLWQVIAHHATAEAIVARELKRFPEHVAKGDSGRSFVLDRVKNRKDRQLELADLVVANSEFVQQSLVAAGVPARKVVCVPTGCPPVSADAAVSRPSDRTGPMVFLSAGTQSVRKGIHLLLDAWKRLRAGGHARLILVGKMELPQALFEGLDSSVSVSPPVSRSDLEAVFRQAAVLVLPTLCEGRAHIVLEALARGLAVITTINSGCQDVVEHGVNGWLVRVGDSEDLLGRLHWCLDHAEEVREMGRASLRKAQSWQEEDFSRLHLATLFRFLREHHVVAAGPAGAPVWRRNGVSTVAR